MSPLVRGSIVRRLSVRRSIFEKFPVVLSCTLRVCIFTALAWAQHPAARTAEGSVHTPALPVSHFPISSAPIIHAPMVYGPTTPRISVAPYSGALGAAGFRPPRRPIRPFPPVLVVYQSPFFLGGPFWGLNSCWWATCDLFSFWPLNHTTVSSPGPISYGPINYTSQGYETTVDVYGEERQDLPQLLERRHDS